jgi:Fungal rhodopsin domain
MEIFQILAVTVFGLFVQGTHYGIGKHIYAIPPQEFESLFYILFWQGLLVVFAVSFVKLSIAFFLLRLAQRTQYRRFLYGVIGLFLRPL